MIWQLSVLACLGVFGGVLSGMIGVGSGIIFVPALIYVGGRNIEQAAAASFVVIFFATLSSILRNTSGQSPVDWRAAALLSAAIVTSSLIRVAINRVVPGTAVVKIAFAVLLLALAYPIAARGQERSEHTPAQAKLHPVLVLLAGVGIGALSGLAGAGGGVVIVPLLILGLGLRLKTAVATSLVVVLFTSVAGAAGYVASGFHQFLVLPPLIVGAVLGAWFGVRPRDRTPDAPLQIGFALFMVIVASQLFIDATDIL
jgi:uncharacterized membrane protein YfcA